MDDRIEDYPTQATDYLPHVIARCIEKANRHGRRFRFSLNGAIAVVSPGQSAEQVQAEIQRQWEAARRPPPAAEAPMEAGRDV